MNTFSELTIYTNTDFDGINVQILAFFQDGFPYDVSIPIEHLEVYMADSDTVLIDSECIIK